MQDTNYMQLAIDLARSTVNQTAPNPSVGAVVVRDNKILGVGCHLFAGSHHAEVYALNMHPDLIKDATLYVTLEPCSHYGKTPPCVNAIIEKGIKKVVIATLDPNPLVNGNGRQKLLDAGIMVEVGLLEEDAKEINKKYFYHIAHQMPYVTLKAGMSLDGKLATTSGESKWITSDIARTDAHLYRATHDAILVGVNTVIADNPALTVHKLENAKNPIRIVLDHNLRTPLSSQILTDKKSPTWIIVDKNIIDEQVKPFIEYELVKIIKLDMSNLESVLKALYTLGVTSILIEGGNKIHTSFLQAKLFNQLVIYMAPKLIGGEQAPQFFAGNGFDKLAESLNLHIENISHIGDDIKVVANRL